MVVVEYLCWEHFEGEGATWPGIDYLNKKELISYKEEVIDEKGVLEYKLLML